MNTPTSRFAGWHKPLLYVTGLMALFAVVGLVGLIVDDRRLVNAPIWLKPEKFAISMGIYTATLSWMLSLRHRARRTGWWAGTVVAASLAGEIVLIFTQIGLRGRQLHFNGATAIDRQFVNVMASTIYLMWGATLLIAILMLFQRHGDRAVTLGIRAGLFVTLTGLALGMLMVFPTPGQRAAMAGGQHLDIVGAHSVGVPDGGPGLPVAGWSTVGGDLRIPHFIGIHALQLLPLLAALLLVLSRRFPRLTDERTRSRLVLVAALGYLGLLALLTWQALRGQSVVHPDVATLSAGAGLLAAVVGAGALGRAPARV